MQNLTLLNKSQKQTKQSTGSYSSLLNSWQLKIKLYMTKKMSMWLAIFAHSLCIYYRTKPNTAWNCAKSAFLLRLLWLFYYNTSWKWNSLTSMHREKSLSSLLLQDKIIKWILCPVIKAQWLVMVWTLTKTKITEIISNICFFLSFLF